MALSARRVVRAAVLVVPLLALVHVLVGAVRPPGTGVREPAFSSREVRGARRIAPRSARRPSRR